MKFGSVLYYSAANGHFECVKYLLSVVPHLMHVIPDDDDSVGQTPLYAACRFGHFSVASLLINEASTEDLRISNVNGYTALYIAAFHGHLAIVSLLVDKDKGAMRMTARDGSTPL